MDPEVGAEPACTAMQAAAWPGRLLDAWLAHAVTGEPSERRRLLEEWEWALRLVDYRVPFGAD